MHFHRPLMELFRSTFGVGRNSINFYKYSQQKECFVGFDQAFARTDMPEAEFFALLDKIASGRSSTGLPVGLFGYFLQYKVVKEMQRRSIYTPIEIDQTPHYRVDLTTKKNKNTGISQHELLYNLSRQNGALVYYACPMLFEKDDLYEIEINLDKLRMADVASCPLPYQDNDNHHIFFNEQQSTPIWCSEPVVGKAVGPKEFFDQVIRAKLEVESASKNAKLLIQSLKNIEMAGLSRNVDAIRDLSNPSILPAVADSLTVLTVQSKDEATGQ